MALKEVLIAAHDSPSGNTKEGDIVVIRDPIRVIGTKERLDYIILTIDDSLLPASTDLRGNVRKHKWNIPLVSLNLSEDRARDPQDAYQPYVDLDADTGRITNAVNKRTFQLVNNG